MAKKYFVNLSLEEQKYLRELVDTRSSKSTLVKRSYCLLAMDENGDKCWPDVKVKAAYNVSIRTLERLRKRFVEQGFEIALNGVKRKINSEIIFDGRVESQLVALRCSEVPDGHSGWSLRLLSDKMVELGYVESISHESVRKILKKTLLNHGELKNG